MTPLPRLMVAPNGARKTKQDHPALPVTIEQTVETAKACFASGADGLHAHVRDVDQKHVLDAGLYSELLAELRIHVPKMQVQITTEAVGEYHPPEQIALVKQVRPKSVSVSTKELLSKGDHTSAADFYLWAQDQGIAVQHILYDTNDLAALYHLCIDHNIDRENIQLLFVLGRYTNNQQSDPSMLTPFLHQLAEIDLVADWAVCAFGQNETDCLIRADQLGGKMRIGFENNERHPDGRIARDNAERVALLKALVAAD